MSRQTVVSINGEEFCINGRPTYEGRAFRGMKIEGLLMNSRMVQGIFDDRNPKTRSKWNYPDTGRWDPERNTREFIAAMPLWRRHGLLAFDINLQGGSPQGYSQDQPWHNNPFEPDGGFGPEGMKYLDRLERILDKADELGMVVMLGIFYFGQDERLEDEKAVLRALEHAIDWVLDKKYVNVLIEIGNEVDLNRYEHPIIKPARCGELIQMVKERSKGKVNNPHQRLLVSTSLSGGKVPSESLVSAGDFVLLHGNGVNRPDRIREMVDQVRKLRAYGDNPQPILFNEDDHFDFDKPDNNFLAAVQRRASWGYFDYRMKDEGFAEGYQSVPVDWGINSERKKGFFKLLAEMTGHDPD